MGEATATLRMLLLGEDRSASKTLRGAAGETDKTAAKFSNMGKVAGLALAAVGVAAIKFGKDSVAAYGESEDAQAELAFAFSKFPKLADASQAAFQDLNSELQKTTKWDDDVTASAQAVMAQFNLTGKQIMDTTPLLQDYASKTKKDLPEAAEEVGKALTGNAKALKSIGINYKSTGDKATDFKNITQLLRDKVGGFATKEATTASGKVAVLGNKFGELQEKVGKNLLPVMEDLTDAGTTGLKWIEDNPAKVEVLGKVFAGLAVTFLAVSAGSKAMAVAHGITTVATGVATAAQWLWNAAMTANPIGVVIMAIAALVAIIVVIATKTTWFQTVWKAMTDAIGAAWRWLWNSLIAPIIRFMLNGFANVTDGIAFVLRALGHIPGFGWAKDAADKMSGAAAKAREMARGINDIPDSHTVKIYVRGFWDSAAKKAASSSRYDNIIYGRATGGVMTAGQPYWVGERGRELVFPDRSAYVATARQSAAVSGAGVSGTGRRSDDIMVSAPIVLQVDGRTLHQALLTVKRQSGIVSMGLA